MMVDKNSDLDKLFCLQYSFILSSIGLSIRTVAVALNFSGFALRGMIMDVYTYVFISFPRSCPKPF
mgnify:CR=1 FL=1